MKRLTFVLLTCLAGITVALAQSQSNEEPIDFTKARALLQKENSGGTLTAEEKAYLERAKEMRRRGQPAGAPGRPTNVQQRKAPATLTPLTDLKGTYEGQDGGLYGGGSNTPPEAHREAALAEIAKIQPLDAQGQPAAEGRIGLVSISMSNATQEFSMFKQIADRSPLKSGKVTIVDCAQGGQAMAEWVPADGRPWEVAMQRLQAAGVSPSQVQVAWIKLANKAPSGSLEEHGKKLESDTLKVIHNAREKFPNLRIAYLGSRIWAGNASGNLNPEPYAYESAFVVRWLIQRQIQGDAELDLSKAPLLLWGPYLWAEGEKGRKIDDLVWRPEDFARDGVHPSTSGREKVANLLLDFMTQDPLAKPWFARP